MSRCVIPLVLSLYDVTTCYSFSVIALQCVFPFTMLQCVISLVLSFYNVAMCYIAFMLSFYNVTTKLLERKNVYLPMFPKF
jgi:hypothetical protein